MSSNAEALVVWFSGLSGAGKSTIAAEARPLLERGGLRVSVVDGDDIRAKAAAHLGFTPADIAAATRIAIDVCRERGGEHDVLLVTRVSPLEEGRAAARDAFGERLFEVYVKASLAAVRARDPKNLYAKAAAGEIAPMIGTKGGTAFEEPRRADLILDTESEQAPALGAVLAQAVLARRKESV